MEDTDTLTLPDVRLSELLSPVMSVTGMRMTFLLL